MAESPRDALVGFLRDGIFDGRHAPGARLPSERELAETFKVSRPMVREILRGLADQGFVEIKAARGTFVRNPEMADAARSLNDLFRRRDTTVRELMEVRLMVETYAARNAARYATEMEVRAMRRCLDDFASARDVLEAAQLDLAFHALVVRGAHNTAFDTIYASISSLVFEMMLRSLSDRQVRSIGAPLHEDVWQAIRDRSPQRAEDAMMEHLTLAESLYEDDYNRSVRGLALRELRRRVGPRASLDVLLTEVSRRHAEFMTAQFRSDVTGP